VGFKRVIEDFTCAHCGASVSGTGYTNHCPKCLYSKHVDTTPGDRLSECQGEMEPIRIEGTTGKGYTVRHKCLRCRIETVTRVAENDNMETILALVKKVANA
jgi:hypothetical protein